jgi:purine-binding chemotaxis protein CheW
MSSQPTPDTSATPAANGDASRQVVVFSLAKGAYAAAIQEVKEVVKVPKITSTPGSPDFILGVMNLRGRILPVINLEQLFELQPAAGVTPSHILVIEDSAGNPFGIQVDEVQAVLKVAEDTIKPAPKMVTANIAAAYVAGVIIPPATPGESESGTEPAGSQTMIVLLNLSKILDQEVRQQLDEVITKPAKEATSV